MRADSANSFGFSKSVFTSICDGFVKALHVSELLRTRVHTIRRIWILECSNHIFLGPSYFFIQTRELCKPDRAFDMVKFAVYISSCSSLAANSTKVSRFPEKFDTSPQVASYRISRYRSTRFFYQVVPDFTAELTRPE